MSGFKCTYTVSFCCIFSFVILLNRRLNLRTLKFHWVDISLYEFFIQLKAREGQEIHVVYMLQIYVSSAHEQKSYIGIHYLYFKKKNLPYLFKHIFERVLIVCI